jgi:hypothetical protein
MEDLQQGWKKQRPLDTLLVLNYLKRKQIRNRVPLVWLAKMLVIGVSIQLLHWRMLRLQRLAERLQMQVMQLREKGLAEKK